MSVVDVIHLVPVPVQDHVKDVEDVMELVLEIVMVVVLDLVKVHVLVDVILALELVNISTNGNKKRRKEWENIKQLGIIMIVKL